MTHLWNPFAIVRKDEGLNYRTHIDEPHTTFHVFDMANQLAQLKLYHWSRSMDWINYVGISSLFDYLFYDIREVSKRQMGRTVTQSTSYRVQKLKARTKDNHKAQMQYVWHDRRDLQYGLEWMLSLWVWRIDNEWNDIRGTDLPKLTEDIFEDMGSLSEADFMECYINPTRKNQFVGERPEKEPDWPSLWVKHGMGFEHLRSDEVRGSLVSLPPEKAGRPKL